MCNILIFALCFSRREEFAVQVSTSPNAERMVSHDTSDTVSRSTSSDNDEEDNDDDEFLSVSALLNNRPGINTHMQIYNCNCMSYCGGV
jgi:hypothetical protein